MEAHTKRQQRVEHLQRAVVHMPELSCLNNFSDTYGYGAVLPVSMTERRSSLSDISGYEHVLGIGFLQQIWAILSLVLQNNWNFTQATNARWKCSMPDSFYLTLFRRRKVEVQIFGHVRISAPEHFHACA